MKRHKQGKHTNRYHVCLEIPLMFVILSGHDQSKPHICQTCGTAYADKKRLNEHIKTHDNGATSESRPYNCDFCGFSSKRKDNLQVDLECQK